MTHPVANGDSLRIVAVNVTDLDDGPVTADLDGVVTILPYDTPEDGEITDANYTGPYALASGSGVGTMADNDWYADFLAPATSGTYRVRIVAVLDDATRTVDVGIAVGAPTPG